MLILSFSLIFCVILGENALFSLTHFSQYKAEILLTVPPTWTNREGSGVCGVPASRLCGVESALFILAFPYLVFQVHLWSTPLARCSSF